MIHAIGSHVRFNNTPAQIIGWWTFGYIVKLGSGLAWVYPDDLQPIEQAETRQRVVWTRNGCALRVVK